MIRRLTSRMAQGATRVEFLDVVTAILVLAVLLYAATRQFPAYRTASEPAPAASQTH